MSGVVTVGRGWPVPNATVTALRNGVQVGRAVTDEQGAFHLDMSAAGPATMVVSAAGYTPSAQSITLPAGTGRLDLGLLVLQQVDSVPVPPPGTWTIDPAHSIVRATARHLALSRVEGRFTQYDGALTIRDDVDRSRVDVRIAAASIDTGNADRDAHLRSPDFLDAERFPWLTYHSSGVERLAQDQWLVHGLLTIRDISREVPLEVTYLGTGPDPWGGTRTAFLGTAQLARRDYEMNWNMGLPTGLVVVGPTLRVDLDIQAVREQTAGE